MEITTTPNTGEEVQVISDKIQRADWMMLVKYLYFCTICSEFLLEL